MLSFAVLLWPSIKHFVIQNNDCTIQLERERLLTAELRRKPASYPLAPARVCKRKAQAKGEIFTPCFYYFLLYKQKKVLVSCKFSISGFGWIDTFWDVLNTIGLFLENVCLSVTKILWQV